MIALVKVREALMPHRFVHIDAVRGILQHFLHTATTLVERPRS
jgi:hypothetical protein